MSEIVFDCPFGCKNEAGDGPVANTPRGWKRHMTKAHKGWDEAQLKAIVGNMTLPENKAGKETFLTEGEQPDRDLYISGAGVTDKPAADEARTVDLKTDAMGRKFNAKLNKMKKAISEKFPKVVSAAVKERGPEWALDDEDTALLAESIENCFDVLDIDFKITPLGFTLQNPLWVLILPALALAMVFVPKSINVAQLAAKERKDDEHATGTDSPSATD